MIELCAYLQTNGVVINTNKLIPACYDNMGKDMIVYFPNITEEQTDTDAYDAPDIEDSYSNLLKEWG